VFGGCFQWVLDAACEAVEWLSQPSGFESLALRSHSTKCNMLDNVAGRVILKVLRRRRLVPKLRPRLTIGAVLFASDCRRCRAAKRCDDSQVRSGPGFGKGTASAVPPSPVKLSFRAKSRDLVFSLITATRMKRCDY
jgi:hypothetical protein